MFIKSMTEGYTVYAEVAVSSKTTKSTLRDIEYILDSGVHSSLKISAQEYN